MLLEVLAQLDPRERWALLERRPQERKDQREPLEIQVRSVRRAFKVRLDLREIQGLREIPESPDQQALPVLPARREIPVHQSLVLLELLAHRARQVRPDRPVQASREQQAPLESQVRRVQLEIRVHL